jgi:hypothetical protein
MQYLPDILSVWPPGKSQMLAYVIGFLVIGLIRCLFSHFALA